MKIVCSRLFLFCINFYLHLSAVLCQATEEECLNENLPALLNQSSSTSTTTFSAIITSYTFGCCGYVSAWGAHINQTSTPGRTTPLNLSFEIWRPNRGGCRYLLIGSNNFSSSQLTVKTNFTAEVVAMEQIGFQSDDVIGISVRRTFRTSHSVRLRCSSSLKGVTLSSEKLKLRRCINLTASRITKVPVITAIIMPTPCPPVSSTAVLPSIKPITDGQNNIDLTGRGLGAGTIAGITISTALVVLLCIVIAVVSLVLVCAKRSKSKKTKQKKTFGKARFIRSVYLLPTLYKASKTDNTSSTKNETTQHNSIAITDITEVEEGEEQKVEQDANGDLCIDQEEFAKVTDPLTPRDEINDDNHLYENYPLVQSSLQKMEKETDQESIEDLYVNQEVFTTTLQDRQHRNGVRGNHAQDSEEEKNEDSNYVNQAAFTQPTSTPQRTKDSSGIEDTVDQQLYVNNLLARKKLKGLPFHENERQDITTTTNRAYGVTDRSTDSRHLQTHQQQEGEVEGEQESEVDGEDEYVYAEVNKDSTDDYEDMAKFRTQTVVYQ